MSDFKIEYSTGEVALQTANLLIKDVVDMETIEYWEERLQRLNQAYVVAYRKFEGKIAYSIFTNLRQKGSAFR